MLAPNLLSPEEKISSSLKWNYLIIKNVILMILLVTFAISLVLFSSKLTLTKKLAEAESQVAALNQARSAADASVSKINRQMAELESAQQAFLPWSSIIWEVLDTITVGITPSSIQFNKEAQSIIIKGVADTRDDLLHFKAVLEAHEMMHNVDLPLNNLLTKENIAFTMTMEFEKIETLLYE